MSKNVNLARSDITSALENADDEDEKRLEWAHQMIEEGFLADAKAMLDPRNWTWEKTVAGDARNAHDALRKHIHGATA